MPVSQLDKMIAAHRLLRGAEAAVLDSIQALEWGVMDLDADELRGRAWPDDVCGPLVAWAARKRLPMPRTASLRARMLHKQAEHRAGRTLLHSMYGYLSIDWPKTMHTSATQWHAAVKKCERLRSRIKKDCEKA